MLRSGAGISNATDARAAGREAAAQAVAAIDGLADAALLFVARHRGDLPTLLRGAGEVLGGPVLVGSSASAVLGSGRALEAEPGVAVLALAGLAAEAFQLPALAGREHLAGAEALAALGEPPRATDLIVLLCDATGLALRPLLASLHEALAPAALVGAGSADAASGAQWCGEELVRGGAVGLLLRAPAPPRVYVTQAARPVTPPLTVTRAAGHWIERLDGRPALDVYREVARAPLARDLRRAASFLMVALPLPGEEPFAHGRYRTRQVVGFCAERRAFAVPEAIGARQEIALALRDREGAREALGEMLDEAGRNPPQAALYLNCAGRGSALFGEAGLEAGYLERALPGVPWVGMHGPAQIGPLGGRPELLTYAGVLALLDAGAGAAGAALR